MLQRGNPAGEENTAPPPPLLLLLTGACPSPAPRSGRADPSRARVRSAPCSRARASPLCPLTLSAAGRAHRRGARDRAGGGDLREGEGTPRAAPPRPPHGPTAWAPRRARPGGRGATGAPPSQTPGLPLAPAGCGAASRSRAGLRSSPPGPARGLAPPLQGPGTPPGRARARPPRPARRGRGDRPPRCGPQRPRCPTPRGPGEPGPRASRSPPAPPPQHLPPSERSERDRLRSFSRKEALPGHCLQRPFEPLRKEAGDEMQPWTLELQQCYWIPTKEQAVWKRI
ncbi:vegetative cell wall protein gp1-like [Cervus elaphus]|uniref:vegetative cell wall protein gp1-like n=1 Tax=Cervus elaphus TaxID=9860 RepID=UPI001CC30B4B|nr:vegetative cell wall protein gp1-like [Cervus elaphus]